MLVVVQRTLAVDVVNVMRKFSRPKICLVDCGDGSCIF